MENRYYQDAQLEAIESNYNKNVRQQVISAATGTGKTHTFTQIPSRMHKYLPGQTMVIAHTDELLDQSIKKIRESNSTLKVSKEKAQEYADSESDIIVASVQSIGRQGTKRLDRFNWDQLDKFITDECHHSPATSYQNIYNKAGLIGAIGNRLHVGFTATPQRADGKALAKTFKAIVHEYPIRQAIEDGFLSDVKGRLIKTKTSLEGVKVTHGDYQQDQLAGAVNTAERNYLVLQSWNEFAKGRQTIGFAVDIKHAQDLAKTFSEHGINAEAIWGVDPDRKAKLDAFAKHEITVLFNCGILTEGYDNPSVSCILLARPTKSGVLYAQMVGRGTRLFEGKLDCLVLDFVDVSTKLSLVTLPTLMGMAAKLDLKGTSMVAAIQRLEAAQEEFDHVDFSGLNDITQLDAYIESVDLFSVKPIPEVDENSEMIWSHSPDGGYIIRLPDTGQVKLTQNLLDQWEIKATIGDKKFKGQRDSMSEALMAADGLIHNEVPNLLKLLQRGQGWRQKPATLPQVKLLRKLFGNKPLPKDLDCGTAARIIDRELAKRDK